MDARLLRHIHGVAGKRGSSVLRRTIPQGEVSHRAPAGHTLVDPALHLANPSTDPRLSGLHANDHGVDLPHFDPAFARLLPGVAYIFKLVFFLVVVVGVVVGGVVVGGGGVIVVVVVVFRR